MPGYEKIESLKNGGSWAQFCWKTCGFERVINALQFILGVIYKLSLKIISRVVSVLNPGPSLHVLTFLCGLVSYFRSTHTEMRPVSPFTYVTPRIF